MDQDLERILSERYLDGLTTRPVTDLRSQRAECQSVEAQLSFLRRMVQGRHDIVTAEASRRESGGDPADVQSLVARLPEILAPGTRGAGPGRRATGVDVPEPSGQLVERLALVADAVQLEAPDALTDQEMRRVAGELSGLEAEVSSLRKAVFERIDAIETELTRRYAAGEARVDDLLTPNPD